MSLKAGSSHRDDSRLPPGIRQRARPRLLLVDSTFRIVQYETAALTLLHELFGAFEPNRLPAAVERALAKAGAHEMVNHQHHLTVMPVSTLIIHVTPIHGGESSFFALLLERASRRAPLAAAARQYALTKREREVLGLAMRGMHAPEIAEALSISPTTVTGYFKILLRKTQSKSRAEMIAKVLGWDESDAHSGHS